MISVQGFLNITSLLSCQGSPAEADKYFDAAPKKRWAMHANGGGNASSLPPRASCLSDVLKLLEKSTLKTRS